MPAEPESLTPQQRLAISRRALVAQLQGREQPAYDREPVDEATAHETRRETIIDRVAWASVARNVVQRWWRRHPANAAGQLARPLIERYAREQPVKLIAAAAGTGALVVLIRPWRLLSITAVLAAVLKTSDVADLVTTLMHKNPNSPPQKDSP
ncbi:hypothetical protein WDL1CHR_04803 [Variovorax sp. WDL1]|nr:hypothetical protein APY03_4365 [Variovorax sp. WDL1]PNG46488.1 hypothetical protein CHC06_06830 [Variovorax sp. B2]PNG47690.1 hypothetical protein CHC07_06857 [Variovorax sp. B4]VTV14240.1 hypothetical protein WDL1CHR_04803 [Variovorax sp. WDL1]